MEVTVYEEAISQIDQFIKRIENTRENDLFTPRTFYQLTGRDFDEMKEYLKNYKFYLKKYLSETYGGKHEKIGG